MRAPALHIPFPRARHNPLLALSLLLCAILTALAPAAPETTTSPAPAVPAARAASNVVIITIDEPITSITAYSVKRRIAAAERLSADAIVFELNTPGGEVGAVLEICDAIKNSPIPNTVAWVNTQAYSGGAIIALACRETVVAEYASMGDAAPIAALPGLGLQSLPETERQKILAPLIAEVVDSARRRGYDEKLVQAFLSLGVELWLLENTLTGERLFADEAEYRRIFKSDPPRTRARISSGASKAKPSPSSTSPAPSDSPEFQPAVPNIDPKLARQIDMGIDKPSERPDTSSINAADWRYVEYVSDGTTLLVLKSDDLKRYGLAAHTVRNDSELRAYFGATTLERLSISWSERAVTLLSSIYVKGALVAIFLIALFIELMAPGIGVAGLVAGACVLALVAPPMLIGAAAWWPVAAIFLGIVLILTELLAFPGLVVFAATGVISLFAGLVGAVVNGPTSASSAQIVQALAIVLLAFFVASIAMYFIGKAYGSFPVLNRLILQPAHDDEPDGPSLAHDNDPHPVVHLHDLGLATNDLRPAGTAEFNGKLVDVVSDTGFIPANTPVRVISATRFRVAVEPAREPSSSTETHA
ncbi:MAG: nodulation protein NfeD [Phycisphaerales bacterium]